MDLGNLGDLFGALFGRDVFARRAGRAPAADAETEAEITLERGGLRPSSSSTLEMVVALRALRRERRRAAHAARRCTTCGGSGQVRQVAQLGLRADGAHRRLPDVPRHAAASSRQPCHECRGRGRRPEPRTSRVAVPAGIDDGQAIRVSGRGHAGEPGARAGDLYVRVHVAADPRFERDGLDLICAVDLTLAEAVLGTTMTVPTLEGEASLEFKPGTQPGEVRVLRGKGMPSLHGGGRGALRVLVNVRVPRT